ncbi:MAG TPA: N-acetylmuramoyl-L-alanine amidase [Kiritimatiellia bacterium]|nr:N-acetylmuramoyl-L-alanine amidase [Kiritimatiellia bacterium]
MKTWIGLATSLLSTAAWGATLDWAKLETQARSMTLDRFHHLLSTVYSPDGGMIDYLQFDHSTVRVFSTRDHAEPPLATLAFSETPDAPAPWWTGGTPDEPLRGLRVALDPGHIGGAWSRMEERFFLVDRADWPVMEAALNLEVMDMLIPRLEELGAIVLPTKSTFDPVTPLRPEDFLEQAEREIGTYTRFPHLPERLRESARQDAIRKRAERLFYRTAEISARARYLNQELNPHLTLAIHFNATGYGDEKTLYEENGLVIFIHGNYLANEVASDEQKFFLLCKLLQNQHELELELAQHLVKGFVEHTGLDPAYRVRGGVMIPVGADDYIYARNLAANRQFSGPVLFLEPYFMNNRIIYQRIQAGMYDGEMKFDNQLMINIFQEYVNAVIDGLLHFTRSR